MWRVSYLPAAAALCENFEPYFPWSGDGTRKIVGRSLGVQRVAVELLLLVFFAERKVPGAKKGDRAFELVACDPLSLLRPS